MAEENVWHEDDGYWEAFGSVMFTEERLARTPVEVDKILALLDLEDGARIVDLGCGVGRHALELARRGFRVTGVDRTRSYLDQARRTATDEGLEVEFVLDDLRNYCRPETFDASLNLFTSFGYYEDPEEDRRCMTNAYKSLKPGGSFLIELIGKEILARIFSPREWREEDGALILEERRVSRNWSWIENRWISIRDNVRTEYAYSHRVYSAVELTSLLTACGFRDVAVYGNLKGAEYDHKAERMVIAARV